MKKVEILKKYWPVVPLVFFPECDTTESTLGRAAVGTAAGAGMGYVLGRKGGAAMGGMLGGLGGGAVRHNMRIGSRRRLMQQKMPSFNPN
jgi:hypothetical protein